MPTKGVLSEFDRYFQCDTYEFYREIARDGQAGGGGDGEDIEAAYLPVTGIDE